MSRGDETDLLIRARRDALSPEERKRLDVVLESSVEERLLFRAGLGFDAQGSAAPGDDLLVERLAARAELRAASRAPEAGPIRLGLRTSRRARRFGPLLAASLYLVLGAIIGVAGAATYFASPFAASPPSAAPNARVAHPPSEPGRVQPAPKPAASAELAMAPSASVRIEATAAPRTPVRASAAPSATTTASRVVEQREAPPPTHERVFELTAPTEVTGESSAVLYAEANRARVRGDLDSATRSYLLLQKRFPASTEAAASRLTLGNLYLVAGHPDLALTQFRAHQAENPSGFGAESAWGIAAALAQLGRRDDERKALRDLLARYPGSVYESAARRKLSEQE